MSDYSKVYNEATGNTIDASDFNTEFSAIETAVNSKVDDGGTLTSCTLTTCTINGGSVVSGTAQATTSGTSFEYTAIPSWVKKITFSFSGVSGAAAIGSRWQIGDSDGYETTGYVSGMDNGSSVFTSTTYFFGASTGAAGDTISGSCTFCLVDSATNTWSQSGVMINDGTTDLLYTMAGTKSLSGTLDRIKVYTPSSTYDAGKINILYEG